MAASIAGHRKEGFTSLEIVKLTRCTDIASTVTQSHLMFSKTTGTGYETLKEGSSVVAGAANVGEVFANCVVDVLIKDALKIVAEKAQGSRGCSKGWGS